MRVDFKMAKCKESEHSSGMTAKYIKANSTKDNFMEMEQCFIQMDRWLKEYGIEVKTYKWKK